MEFLGQSKPLRLILRYPEEYLQKLQRELEGLSPLALALPPQDTAKATKSEKKWLLKGHTGDSLGLAIRCPKQFQMPSAMSCTPPTPALCSSCRAQRLSLGAVDPCSCFAGLPLPSAYNILYDNDKGKFNDNVDYIENADASHAPPDAVHTPARDVGCTCIPRTNPWTKCQAFGYYKTIRNGGSTKMPLAPLYRSKTFPTLQMLLSGSLEKVLPASVTSSAFRKHLLRLKPELKVLVPALAQADAEADADDSDHGTATSVPPRSPAASAHEEDLVAGGEAKELDEARARKRKKMNQIVKENRATNSEEANQKQQLTKQGAAAEVDMEDSQDEDRPLMHKLQEKMMIAANLAYDTPPDTQNQHEQDGDTEEDELENGEGIKKSKCKFDYEVAKEPLLAGNCNIPKAAGLQDTEPSYSRKRWKVVNLSEKKRSDGSWAMTLRIVRKRT